MRVVGVSLPGHPNVDLDEAALRQKLFMTFATMWSTAHVIRFEDRFRAGTPDAAIIEKGTTFLEIKHCNPKMKKRDVQTLEACKIAAVGSCYYVIYHIDLRIDRRVGTTGSYQTIVADPWQVLKGVWLTENLLCVPGLEHESVVEFVRSLPIHR